MLFFKKTVPYGHDPELPFDRFPVRPGKIDYLFLTHAHIDHIGRVPDLIDAGFRGEIICTHATKALLIPMLHDAMSFSDRTGKDVHRLEGMIDDLSWGFELYETFSLKQGITFQLSNAGHILGSCFIRFEIPNDTSEIQNSKLKTQNRFSIVFSGDLGCTDTPILPDPDTPDACDLLIFRLFQVSMRATKRQFKTAKMKIPYQNPSLLKWKYPCFYWEYKK